MYIPSKHKRRKAEIDHNTPDTSSVHASDVSTTMMRTAPTQATQVIPSLWQALTRTQAPPSRTADVGWFNRCRRCSCLTAREVLIGVVMVPVCPRCRSEVERMSHQDQATEVTKILAQHVCS
jgi:phage FluMu protein Com